MASKFFKSNFKSMNEEDKENGINKMPNILMNIEKVLQE